MPNKWDAIENAHRIAGLIVLAALESYVLNDTSTLVIPILKDECPDDTIAMERMVMAELEDLAHYLSVAYR